MRRLIIAIDCDDVLVPSTEFIVREYNLRYGTNVQLAAAHASGSDEWGVDGPETQRRINEIQSTPEYGAVAPFKEAIEVCKRMALLHELHLVTARDPSVLGVTRTMLDTYFPGLFSNIEHVGLHGNKGEICQSIAADMLIDDNMKHLRVAAQYGVSTLVWFGNYPWQRADVEDEFDEPIRRCLDWLSVEKEVDGLAGA